MGRKLADFTESGTVAIRREPRVLKPNIWPPTSRMEWRGCSFFRGRKQWMLLEGWGPEWGPARVTDMWMSGSALLFKLDLLERGQGDLWKKLSSILMFQLLVAHGTKMPSEPALLVGFFYASFRSVEGILTSRSVLVGSRHPSYYSYSSRDEVKPLRLSPLIVSITALSAHYIPLHWAKQAFKLFYFFFHA